MVGSIKLTSNLLFAEEFPCVASFSDIILINKILMSLMQDIRYPVMKLSNKEQHKFPPETWWCVIAWRGISDTQLQNCPTSNLDDSPPDLHLYQYCNYAHALYL